MDSTVKTLYGHQEGAEIGYNPAKPGRPSHAYHTYMLSSLRLVLRVDVLPGDEYNVAHATDGLWSLLDHLGPTRRPALLRGDKSWGIERVMSRAEQNDLAYLFRLRMTANVKRDLVRAMRHSDWADAGQGWQGKETSLRLHGWSRHRRIILLRRKLAHGVAISDRSDPAQPLLSFGEVEADKELWEYAALVTSLKHEILTLGQLYRDRADCENVFDELKNQWGWGGFTTQDLHRCRLLAGTVALVYNWWSLFTRLADPEHHREAMTSRPLLLSAIARQTQHAGQVTLSISSTHGRATKHVEPMCGSPASWPSCGSMRSSWTRCKVVSYPQRGLATLPARTPTSAAAAPRSGLKPTSGCKTPQKISANSANCRILGLFLLHQCASRDGATGADILRINGTIAVATTKHSAMTKNASA